MWWLLLITLLTYAELRIPNQQKQIKDIGFEITKELHKQLEKNPKLNSALALFNTIILLYCNLFYIYDSIVNGWSPLVKKFTFLYIFRFIVGYCTRLPKAKDIIEDKTEVPPRGCNFFFLFSAHTTIIYIVGVHFVRNIYEVSILVIIIFLQSIRLLATRGHYSADIILGLVLSHLIHIILN